MVPPNGFPMKMGLSSRSSSMLASATGCVHPTTEDPRYKRVGLSIDLDCGPDMVQFLQDSGVVLPES